MQKKRKAKGKTMTEQLKAYAINKDTFKVEELNYEASESYVKAQSLFDKVLQFEAENYTRLWGKDVSANELAKELTEILASKHADFGNFEDKNPDDVRYAVYWQDRDHKFVPVCIQDFDVQDYTEENFVRGADGVVEFWRSNYYAPGVNCDALAEELATHVCKRLNEAQFVV